VSQRHKGVKLRVIRRDHRPAQTPGERKAERIGQSDRMSALQGGCIFPVGRIVFVANDDSRIQRGLKGILGPRNASPAKIDVVYFGKVEDVGIANASRLRKYVLDHFCARLVVQKAIIEPASRM
jgi:hypothetical protein